MRRREKEIFIFGKGNPSQDPAHPRWEDPLFQEPSHLGSANRKN